MENNNLKIKLNQILIILFFNFLLASNLTPPPTPELKAIAFDGFVVLTWDKVAEESIDPETGYRDFEGYRLYKSTDGGATWGQPIPVNGQIVGYQPLFQTDYTEFQDTTKCVYQDGFGDGDGGDCDERDVEISGPDPVAPWFNLGNNSFLSHSYQDINVTNGVEYTYAITAYDMGLRIGNTELINCRYREPDQNEPYNQFQCEALVNQNTEEPYCEYTDPEAEHPCDWVEEFQDEGVVPSAIIDTSWKRTGNPAKHTCPDGWMCPSFESARTSESFTDFNANGIRDVVEVYYDLNGNNTYDYAEDFIDSNNNGQWDDAICQNTEIDTFEDCINNGYCSDESFSNKIDCEELKECTNSDYTNEASCISNANGNCINHYDEVSFTYNLAYSEVTCTESWEIIEDESLCVEFINASDEASCNSIEVQDENIEVIWNDGLGCYYWHIYEEVTINQESICENAPEGCINSYGLVFDTYDNHVDCVSAGFYWQTFDWITHEWVSVNTWNPYLWIDEEIYIDSNNNNEYDSAEQFDDLNNNGIWDSIDEPFIDCGYIDCVTFEGELICEFDDDWAAAWINEQVEPYWVCEGDSLWSELNYCSNINFLTEESCVLAGHDWITESAGNGVWDQEREHKINVVTITPSVNAVDITFPNGETLDEFFIADSANVGTAKPGDRIDIKLVDEYDLEPYFVKMEIQADGALDDFEGFKTRNPFLYVWRVNNPVDQDLVAGYFSEYTISSLTNEELQILADMPGSEISEDGLYIYVPTYIINPHPIVSVDEPGSEANFTEWFSGIQLRFDNYLFELPQTNSFASFSDIAYLSADSTDYIASNTNEAGEVNIENPEQLLPWILGEFDIPGQWWTNSRGDLSLSYRGGNTGSFAERPMFTYRIDFSTTTNLDTAYRSLPTASQDFCNDVTINNPNWNGDRDEVAFLPMKVTNLTTGRQVRSWHTDKGIYTADDASSAGDPGYGDCVWNPNETLSFQHDILSKWEDANGNDVWDDGDQLSEPESESTFELVIDYKIEAMRLKYGSDDVFTPFELWESDVELDYPTSTIVEYNETLWEASELINQNTIYPEFCDRESTIQPPCPPNSIYDIDGDNVNDNPWKQLYPWEDGDHIIITPDKWYQDGDNWVADLSLLGKEDSSLLTEQALDNIYVVPNPYIVSSPFNENLYGNRLMFDNLPKQCKISIFTITGELVDEIDHGSETNLDGIYLWDMKNKKGNVIKPGIYIYAIETDKFDPHLGKFVIIK